VNPVLLLLFIEDELPAAPFNRRICGGRGWTTCYKNITNGAGQLYLMSTTVAHYLLREIAVSFLVSVCFHKAFFQNICFEFGTLCANASSCLSSHVASKINEKVGATEGLSSQEDGIIEEECRRRYSLAKQ